MSPARRWAGLAGLGAALLLALALVPGGLAPAAARAALVAAGLALAAATLRRAGAVGATPRRLVILARQPLGRDVGVALAELDGRPLLLGFGAGGVQVLAGEAPEGGPPDLSRARAAPGTGEARR